MRVLHEESTTGEELLGLPWSRPLAGTLDRLVVESELLADNPLGDPARRPLYVLRPPGVERDHPRPLPTVYVLQGYFGEIEKWCRRDLFSPTGIERFDQMLADPGCPDAILVFPDCWTTYGGSQFLDSTGTGRYRSYLCEEIVKLVGERYPTATEPARRGVSGHSSGGYGAMVTAMKRPDLFGALVSHAGDALFEVTVAPGFPETARILRDRFQGNFDVFFEQLAEAERFDFPTYGDALMNYGYAACYSPDPNRAGRALLPFDIGTGALLPDVWEKWLEQDPVRMIADHADALRGMRHVRIDSGRNDEYYMDLAATALHRELDGIGVTHEFELFEGRHSGNAHRYPAAMRALIQALAR